MTTPRLLELHVAATGPRPIDVSATVGALVVTGGGVTALDDLADVDAGSPSDGEALVWDAGGAAWVPASMSGDAHIQERVADQGTVTDGTTLVLALGDEITLPSADQYEGVDLHVTSLTGGTVTCAMGGSDVNIYTSDQTAPTVPAAQVWRFYGIDLGGGSWAWAFVADAWGVVSGHDGEVLTGQADGSIALEALPAGVAVSDGLPEALGAAGAGASGEASRSDHVHPMPSAADVGADPARLWSRLASDVTIQSDDSFGASGLSVAVESSKVYRLHAQLLVGGSSAADAKFSITLPAGATLLATAVFSSTAAAGSTQYTALAGAPGILSITEGATIAVGAPGADTRHWPCIVDGIVTTGGTAGDCAIEWAQNTSTAANTVLHQQSWLELVEVS